MGVAAPVLLEPAVMAPVSTELTEVEVTGTVLSTVVVLVEASEVGADVLAGTAGVECELSVLRPELEDEDDGNGLGRVEAREKVSWADRSTDNAFSEPDVEGEEDSGAYAGGVFGLDMEDDPSHSLAAHSVGVTVDTTVTVNVSVSICRPGCGFRNGR